MKPRKSKYRCPNCQQNTEQMQQLVWSENEKNYFCNLECFIEYKQKKEELS